MKELELNLINRTKAIWFTRTFFNGVMTFHSFYFDERLPQNDSDIFINQLTRAETNHDCDADIEDIRLSNMIDEMQSILTLWGDDE